MDRPLIPDQFKVPLNLKTERFKLRMLTINDVIKDYEAITTSIKLLQGLFGSRSNWPTPELSLEQNLIDLGWHQKEFQMRSSFAYIVLNLEENKSLGCVYIFPSDASDTDAEIFLWARESEWTMGPEQFLFNVVKDWINTEWPFQNVVYPDRNQISGERDRLLEF